MCREKRRTVMRDICQSRQEGFPIDSRRHGQAVLLATLIMFVIAAVGAGFILFVNSSMNLSQRAREEQEAFVLAQAGLAFADAQLTERGADWRPSVMVDFDEFEVGQGWNRPDSDNDWYGKYAARQVADLLGRLAGSGAFLVKVKYLPNEQVFKIISIGRPKPNSPVYRRLVAYKALPTDWVWVTAQNEDSPDPLLIDADGDNDVEVLAGQAINWLLAQNPNFFVNAERDPLQPVSIPNADPDRIWWLRLRTWLSPNRLPIWDRTVVFTSTVRINSDLLWYGVSALETTSFFASAQTVLEVARTIRHDQNAQVFVYADDPSIGQDVFLGMAVPSAFGTPPGSGFLFFPVGGIPRYMDGWERVGGLLPVRWVFNFPRRVEPRPAPTINMGTYYAQTRDADPPYSQNGYYRQPDPLRGQTPVLDNDPSDDNTLFPTFGFHVLNYFNPNNPADPTRLLVFRGIYIDNSADRQFTNNPPADAPASAFNDANGTYRPELAQVYDWVVKPPQLDPTNPNQLHPRRQQPDSGWLQEDTVNAATERNIVETSALDANGQTQPLNFARRFTAPHLYVPPGVEVRFDVIRPDPQNNPQILLQRTWLIRHDGQPFRAPDGTPLTPPNNRLVFLDPVQLVGTFDADGDGRVGEDPINLRDDDGDGKVDEDPPQTAFQNDQMPTIVIVAEGNIRVSGQVAVSVKIVTPETIYIEGPLHPVTANATVELLAKRNICLNFAAARTPIPSLDGLKPQFDRALLVPQFRIEQVSNIQGAQQYFLPNLTIAPQFDRRLPLFADLLGGSVGALRFPEAVDENRDGLVDTDQQGRSPHVTYALSVPFPLPLSDELVSNFGKLQSGEWTLRLVLLHRGLTAVPDPQSPTGWRTVRNPWTNLEVDLWFDENGDGVFDPQREPRARLYGPGEPVRTFPVASRWYQGDGRQIDPNDPTTGKEWGILDIAIPPTVPGLLVDRDNDGKVTANDLRLSLQRLRITVTSPVAGEVIPQGRTPVPYELAGIKLALYDENGMPRPIWQPTTSLPPQQPASLGSPFFLLAQTIHAENGTIGMVPPPYFDPTAHPSWQQLIASTDPNWQTRFRQWQRLWSLYYLRQNSVRWTPFLDPTDPNLPLPNFLRARLHAQSVPVFAGQLIMRVTPQTMLWRLAAQNAIPAQDPFKAAKDAALRFAWEASLDKAAFPYQADLAPQSRLADLLNLQRPVAPVFAEAPKAMFASAWLWVWRAATPSGVLAPQNFLPPFFRAPVVPNLNLPKGYVMVLQQQVGKD